MSKSIPTYIFEEILESIIKHLLQNINSELFSSLFSNIVVDEILNYALVSKRSFNFISLQLSNSLSIDNCGLLKRVIEPYNSNNNNNNSNSFKLIKSKDSIKVFTKYNKFNNEIKNNNCSNYKNIIFITSDPSGFKKVILNLSSLPENVQLYLLVPEEVEYKINDYLNNSINQNHIKKIKSITLDYGYSPALYNLIKSNVKNIIFNDKKDNISELNLTFQTTCPSNLITIDKLVFSNPLPTLPDEESESESEYEEEEDEEEEDEEEEEEKPNKKQKKSHDEEEQESNNTTTTTRFISIS